MHHQILYITYEYRYLNVTYEYIFDVSTIYETTQTVARPILLCKVGHWDHFQVIYQLELTTDLYVHYLKLNVGYL